MNEEGREFKQASEIENQSKAKSTWQSSWRLHTSFNDTEPSIGCLIFF